MKAQYVNVRLGHSVKRDLDILIADLTGKLRRKAVLSEAVLVAVGAVRDRGPVRNREPIPGWPKERYTTVAMWPSAKLELDLLVMDLSEQFHRKVPLTEAMLIAVEAVEGRNTSAR